jgi:type IV pilus assembly protein PilY1
MAIAAYLPLSTMALTLSTQPLFIASTEPRVMLLLSRDHELSRKAYTDYTDLNGDGVLDTTYNNAVNYYGYFDSGKCYSYSGSYFVPSGAASSHQCNTFDPVSSLWVGTGWSGNFLNWATMTRLDVVRKVLYGGFRSTDNTGTALGTTVLERAFLPPDVHAFAKVYAGGLTEVRKYTPYLQDAITLCNVTDMGAGVQAGSINTVNGVDTSPAPLIKVASGSWPQWAMTEILQCQWKEDFAAETSPTRPIKATGRLTGGSDLIARVAVCAPGMLEDKCKSYYTRASPPVETVKPIGLLQQYSDVDADRRVRFGLMSGSYKKNTAGGVLRKNIKLLSNNAGTAITSSTVCGDNNANDEINVCTGQFINQATGDSGIVDSINRIHIAGYKTPAAGAITATNVCAGGYGNAAPYACNASDLLSGTLGTCVDWGNPLSEMYYEAMRYFTGKIAATAGYATDDSAATAVIAGLGQDAWTNASDPLPATEWCALSNIIVLSTGLTSLDNATITSDIAGLDPAVLTNAVGTAEGVAGHAYLIGSNGTTTDSLCNSKTLANLSSASGICPELPHMKGGYLISGLANANRSIDLRPGYATNRATRWTGINADWVARQPLGTYTVGLAENMPSFEITVGSGKISLVPACRSNGSTICSMTDLRVLSQTATAGSFLVSWEDGSAGSDYDMDTIARIQYCVGPTAAGCNDGAVTAGQMRVKVSAVQSATGSGMELGYTVSGSSADGTVFPVKIPGTATCDPSNGAGNNANYFSLLTNPKSSRLPAAYLTWPSCPSEQAMPTDSLQDSPGVVRTVPPSVLPSGIVNAGGCPSGSNCGCPKTTTYTQSATPAGLLKNPLWYAAKYGSPSTAWDLKNNVTGALTPDGEPDHFFDVRNPADLYNSLADVFDAASQPDASASSVATNSTNLQIKSRVFQAKFSSADWSGQVLSYKFNPGTTVLSTTADWDASVKINAQNPTTGRVILTKGTSDGVAFAYGNLTGTQQAYLDTNFAGATDTCGVERVAFLRGVKTHEGSNGTFTCASTSTISNFRPRTTSVLGDVVNSSPWYVGEPKAGFSDVDYPGYAAFRTSKMNRLPVVYVAGNDGMLHGFDASLNYTVDGVSEGQSTTHSGNEVLAYIPSAVYPNLSKLTDLKYNKNHQYFVDGSVMVGDVYLASLASDKWRTVLVGGLGAGGKGYYALDISNPGTVDNAVSGAGTIATAGAFSESGSAPVDTLLWEFDETDMGYAFNMPPAHANTNQAKQIVKMANGKWAAIVGNGYNSVSGKAVLYILFIDDGLDGWGGTDYVKIVADASGSNGLSTPVPFDSDGDGVVDTVYAGDLKGNMWKFEVGPNVIDGTVTATNVTTTWKVSLSGAAGCATCTPLFSATDGGSPAVAQPIVWPPEVTRHPDGGRMVLFGTGKYLESSDNADSSVQSFYGIWDHNSTVTRSSLVQQSVTAETITVGGVAKPFRTTSTNSVDYAGSNRGWYINLPTSRERVTGVPKLENGIIWFNTLIPSTSPCDAGGTGWLMSLDYLAGKMPSERLYDTNNDGSINSSDTLVSGFKVGAAIGGTTLIRSSTVDGPGVGVSSLTSGALSSTLLNLGAGKSGRMTWREIFQ